MMNIADLKIRMGRDGDGEVFARLAESCGFTFENFEIDWSDIGESWVVAEYHGELIGAIQTLPGKPIGRLEILLIDPHLGFKGRVLVYKALLLTSMNVLKQCGSQLAAGVVPFEMKDYARFAKKRGWVCVASGDCMMARLR